MPRIATVIGYGNAGKRHAQAWADAGWHVGVCEKGHDWRMLAEASDAVSICTPDNLHCEMTCFALEHGKHVLCEKPLTHRMDELGKIEAAVRAADGQTFGTNFPLRHVPLVEALLPEQRWIDCIYRRGHRPSSWRDNMPGYSLLCGGTIHLVDLMIANDRRPLRACKPPPPEVELTSGRLVRQGGKFLLGETRVLAFADFTSEFPHRVQIRADDRIIFDATEGGYDKLADIRQFIADVENGNPGNGAGAIRANRICIEMSCTR